MTSEPTEDDLLYPAEVRQLLGISTATYSRWLRDGRLPGVRIGRKWRFRREVVEGMRSGQEPVEAGRARALDAALEQVSAALVRRGRSMEEIEAMIESRIETQADDLATLVLEHALGRRASDLHISPAARGVDLRERIDGILQPYEPPLPAGALDDLVGALKARAGMEGDVVDRPQVGRFFARVGERAVDVRAATYPTDLGESITLRLLDPSTLCSRLSDIDLPPAVEAGLRRAIGHQHGVVLLNGPTDAGKSTTLYCLLHELRRPGIKIMTAEDPVEIHIDGIVQAAVHEGMTFLDAMRAMAAGDLDVGLVSEMRDAESLRFLFQVASVGHLMLTSLHAPSAAAALARVLELGIEPRTLVECLRAVVDQRLVARSCRACRRARPLTPAEATALGLVGPAADLEVAASDGCEVCSGTGTSGRLLVAGLVEPDDRLVAVLRSGTTDPAEIAAAIDPAGPTLEASALDRLRSGDITPARALAALGRSAADL